MTAGARRAWARWMAILAGATVAVVGIAAPASAHHNTITATVACRDGGGWVVSWKVENSEYRTEKITYSSRPTVVPVNTVLTSRQTLSFTEVVTTKPATSLGLTLSARWDNGVTATNSGGISSRYFSDSCNVTTVEPPKVPVIDECGPGNATLGPVPNGPWTSKRNPDGSLTITALPGHTFGPGRTSLTIPAPVDSNEACPLPPTPPVEELPEVLPAQSSAVRAGVQKIDKCGRQSDMYKVARRAGVVYKVNGKVVRQGTWLRAKTPKVTVRAEVAGSSYTLVGKQVWRLSFTTKACAKAPEVAPATGA